MSDGKPIIYRITERGIAKIRDTDSAFYVGVSPEALKILDEVLNRMIPKPELMIAYENGEHLTSTEANAEFHRRRRELGIEKAD